MACAKCSNGPNNHPFFCACKCHIVNPGPVDHYVIGEAWYSHDNGLTWERFPSQETINRNKRTGTMIVIGIDKERGEIKIKVCP